MAYIENTWQDGDVITAAGLNHIEDGIADNDTHIGNLANLTTTAKSNLVAAINEVAQSGGGGSAFVITLTFDDGDVYSDKTYAQITAAISAGQYVYATDGIYIFSYDGYNTDDDIVRFSRIDLNTYNIADAYSVTKYSVSITPNSVVAYTEVTDGVAASASVSNGSIVFKDGNNTTLFSVTLPIYTGGVS